MKIKLDENLGTRCAELVTSAGHDVATVSSQGISGIDDVRLIELCSREQRCLLTLDLDFANPLRFPPFRHHGVAVVRLPARPGVSDLIDTVRTFVSAIEHGTIAGKLWIVETGRIRIYRPDPDE